MLILTVCKRFFRGTGIDKLELDLNPFEIGNDKFEKETAHCNS